MISQLFTLTKQYNTALSEKINPRGRIGILLKLSLTALEARLLKETRQLAVEVISTSQSGIIMTMIQMVMIDSFR